MKREPWNDWMSKVADRLLHTHGIGHDYIRPTQLWRTLFKQGETATAAANLLAEKLKS